MPDDLSHEARIERLEKRFSRFSMIGGQDVNVAGSLPQGYAVNLGPRGGGTGITGTTGPTGPTGPPATGACCFGDDCSELTAADCASSGGLYQGDNTSCTPSPCATGACCQDTVCSDGTEASCEDLDGFFQGIGTSCDTTPCASGACCFGADCVEPISQTDCVEAEGVWLGDGSTCGDPGCPSGACCFGGDCFEGYTADTCANAAGNYKGDDSVCDPNPCGACPSIAMTCDSVYAAKSKCGFFFADKYYRQKTHTFAYSISASCDPDFGSGGGSFSETVLYDLDCTNLSPIDRSGSGGCSSHASPEDDFGDCFATTVILPGFCGSGSFYGFTASDLISFATYSGSVGGTSICPSGCACGCGCCGNPGVVSQSSSDSFDAEYSTSELMSNTEAALPAYSGVYTGGACAASRYLADDEGTYSIQRSKPKFSFTPSPINFLLCYNEVFTPASGGGATTVTRCLSVSAGQTEVFGPELREPSSNGTVSIQDITCTPS